MLKSVSPGLLLLLAFLSGNAQSTVTLSGVIRDGNGNGLPSATIILMGHSDTLSVLSQEKGGFIIQVAHSGEYILSISMQGFKAYQARLSVNLERPTRILPPIVLLTQYEDLVPVMVIREKPVTVHGDTVDYHASAYHVRPGAELERLMMQLPGVDFDTAGNIIIDGKTVGKIMIDGQPFTVTSLKEALKVLPVDIIDKVQVIDDYGDEARLTGVKSGESDKVLNIVLKKDKHNGGIGNVQTGLGNDDNSFGKLFGDAFKGKKQISFAGLTSSENLNGPNLQKGFNIAYTDTWRQKWIYSTDVNLLNTKSLLNSRNFHKVSIRTTSFSNNKRVVMRLPTILKGSRLIFNISPIPTPS